MLVCLHEDYLASATFPATDFFTLEVWESCEYVLLPSTDFFAF